MIELLIEERCDWVPEKGKKNTIDLPASVPGNHFGSGSTLELTLKQHWFRFQWSKKWVNDGKNLLNMSEIVVEKAIE